MQPGAVLIFEIAAQIAGALSGRRVRQIAAGMLLYHVRLPTSARTPSLCLALPLAHSRSHALSLTPLAPVFYMRVYAQVGNTLLL